jgi:hypothetical protein
MNILKKLESRFDPYIVFPDKTSKEAYDTIIALEEAVRRSMLALDDWLNVYASEFCDEKRVAEARKRVYEYGTLAYITEAQEVNRAALKKLNKDEKI